MASFRYELAEDRSIKGTTIAEIGIGKPGMAQLDTYGHFDGKEFEGSDEGFAVVGDFIALALSEPVEAFGSLVWDEDSPNAQADEISYALDQILAYWDLAQVKWQEYRDLQPVGK